MGDLDPVEGEIQGAILTRAGEDIQFLNDRLSLHDHAEDTLPPEMVSVSPSDLRRYCWGSRAASTARRI